MKGNIVTLGGGSGHSQVLKALKGMPGVKITAVCPSTDSGGSTGILRREYGGSGYTGDLTKCIAALCENETLAEALMFRYEGGALAGHSVKNVLFHALEKTQGTKKALETIGKICGLGEHQVIPVSRHETELCAKLKVGNTILGETAIDEIAKNPLWNPESHAITDIYLKPSVPAGDDVLKAIESADHIIVSPGDLYSSILPVLLPHKMKESIKKSKAKITLVLNIMNKKGETDDYTPEDFIKKIESKLGRKADSIVSNSSPIPRQSFIKYSLEGKSILRAPKKPNGRKIIPMALAKSDKKGQIWSDPIGIRRALETINNQ